MTQSFLQKTKSMYTKHEDILIIPPLTMKIPKGYINL